MTLYDKPKLWANVNLFCTLFGAYGIALYLIGYRTYFDAFPFNMLLFYLLILVWLNFAGFLMNHKALKQPVQDKFKGVQVLCVPCSNGFHCMKGISCKCGCAK